jgi:hypothetical protein
MKSHVIVLSSLLVLSCAAEEATPAADATGAESDALPGGTLSAFELVAPQDVAEGLPFELTVRALAAEGGKVRFGGIVKIATDRGDLDVDTVTLTDGKGSADIVLNREGSVTLTATADGVTSSASITVEHNPWRRDPAQGGVASGLQDTWFFAGFRGAHVIVAPGGGALWAYFATSATVDDEGVGYALGRAVSIDDGMTWTPDPDGPILLPETVGAAGILNPAVVVVEGGYHLWFEALSGEPGQLTSAIRFARSTDGVTFTLDDCPLLGVNAYGAVTSRGLGSPAVLRGEEPDSYILYFTAYEQVTQGVVGRIGRASGTVGAGCAESFTDGGIVLDVTGKGTWSSQTVTDPTVWVDGSVVKLLYAGSPRSDAAPAIGYATSDDGFAFEPSPENPVLRHETWDAQGVTSPSRVSAPLGERLFFTGLDINDRPRLARSVR